MDIDVKEVHVKGVGSASQRPTHALLLSGPWIMEEKVLITN